MFSGLIAAPVFAATPSTGISVLQTNPNWVSFQAIDTFDYVDVGSGYRTADTWNTSYVGNSYDGQPLVTNSSQGSLLAYSITFDTPGVYHLYERLSLLNIDGGGDDELPSSYVNNNSIYLPHAFDDINVGDKPGLEGSLADARRNVFDNSQWPFPHGGHYAWSITELGSFSGNQPNGVIYHNYSLFPSHQLEVTQADIDAGGEKTLYIKSRERGFALDAFALVNQNHLPVAGDDVYHPEFDGEFLDQYHFDDITIGSGQQGEVSFYETTVRRFDWTGDGVPDATEAHPIHFSGGWEFKGEQFDVFALDLVVPGTGQGDTHPDTGIDVNGRRFETHFGGYDPDGGANQPFLDALFLTDYDDNGRLGVGDADLLSGAVATGASHTDFDVNQDGNVDANDVLYWARVVYGTEGGDTNLDFSLDETDLDALAGVWQSPAQGWSGGDFDSDGVADEEDLAILKSSWLVFNGATAAEFDLAWSQALGRAGFLVGDYNGSGQVEQGDLDLVLQNWGLETDVSGVPVGWIHDNANLGKIEQAELDDVLTNWGNSGSPVGVQTSVPEPGLLIGVAGMMTALRRRTYQ